MAGENATYIRCTLQHHHRLRANLMKHLVTTKEDRESSSRTSRRADNPEQRDKPCHAFRTISRVTNTSGYATSCHTHQRCDEHDKVQATPKEDFLQLAKVSMMPINVPPALSSTVGKRCQRSTFAQNSKHPEECFRSSEALATPVCALEKTNLRSLNNGSGRPPMRRVTSSGTSVGFSCLGTQSRDVFEQLAPIARFPHLVEGVIHRPLSNYGPDKDESHIYGISSHQQLISRIPHASLGLHGRRQEVLPRTARRPITLGPERLRNGQKRHRASRSGMFSSALSCLPARIADYVAEVPRQSVQTVPSPAPRPVLRTLAHLGLPSRSPKSFHRLNTIVRYSATTTGSSPQSKRVCLMTIWGGILGMTRMSLKTRTGGKLP